MQNILRKEEKKKLELLWRRDKLLFRKKKMGLYNLIMIKIQENLKLYFIYIVINKIKE